MNSQEKKLEIFKFFEAAIDRGASDIIFTAGVPPSARLNGAVVQFDLPPLTPDDSLRLLYSVLSQDQIAQFEREWELDFSVQYRSKARFRGNAYRQKGASAFVFRLIPALIPSLDDLNLPAVLTELGMQPQGLLLFTGPTGHGKSTSQAALLDLINQHRRCHIVTVEDPIEYLHTSKKSIIDQREVGDDTHTFAAALKHVLRQDPDVIQIGELRDLESMSVALTAAETGHMVLATLHTNSAVQSVDRIIDVFPPHQQNQIRTQLSFCLLAIVSQRLLPRADGKGRIPVVEVLRNVPAVANLIREGKTQQIGTIIETHAKIGMQSLDSALKDLYRRGVITRDIALKYISTSKALD
ncbi:MAG TPA: PilT/PilU family type 4a pilus ATPase [Planctomycetota bacterium]|jgi:twitching motility protein PilT